MVLNFRPHLRILLHNLYLQLGSRPAFQEGEIELSAESYPTDATLHQLEEDTAQRR